MKKLLGYFLLMIMIIVILPLIIVRGCSTVITDIVPEDDKREEQKQEQKKEQTQAGKIKLKVYIKDKGTVEEMPLEEYKRVLWRLRCLLILSRKPLRHRRWLPVHTHTGE